MSAEDRHHQITLTQVEDGLWIAEGYEEDTAGRTPFEALGKLYEVAAVEAGLEWPPSGDTSEATGIGREELDRRADEIWADGGDSLEEWAAEDE